MLNKSYFMHAGSRFFAFENPSNTNNCSCVVVEDEPGAYWNLLRELVESGECAFAAVVPFDERSLNLLYGHEVAFEDVRLKVPVLSRCVVILDMRNETSATFEGEEEKQLAGYYFRRRLGSEVRPFFATRYGSDRFRTKGMGCYGFIDLEYKGGMSNVDLADVSRGDYENVRAAVRLGIQDARFMTRNSMLEFDDTVIVNFRGWVISLKKLSAVQLIIEIIKSAPGKIHNNELCRLINSGSYIPGMTVLEEDLERKPPRKKGKPEVEKGFDCVGNDDFDEDELEEDAGLIEESKLDPREFGKNGSMNASKGRKIKDTISAEELRKWQQIVKDFFASTEGSSDRLAELEKSIAKAEKAVPELRELYDQLQHSDRDMSIDDLLPGIIRHLEKRHPNDTSEDIKLRIELLKNGLRALEESGSLKNSMHSGMKLEDLKRYRNLLYQWKLAGFPDPFIVYTDYPFTQSVPRYINRWLKDSREDPRIPSAFLDHLRHAIDHYGDFTVYDSDEEWVFK